MSYGPARFTLSVAADATGLSPATLMQRFGSKRELILAVLRRSNDLLGEAIAAEKPQISLASIVDMLCDWTSALGEDNFSEQMQWLVEDTRDGAFQELAQERFRLMRAAISARLPETTMPENEAVQLIEAQWHGILMRWGVDRDGDLQHSLRSQLKPLMSLLEIKA